MNPIARGKFPAPQGSAPRQGLALVVDDEPSNRVLLRTLLRRQGYRVLEATNGAEAVTVATAERPDVVFMDVMMPLMDGYQAAGHIKSLSGDHFIPIIFLTALTDEESLAHCIDAGGDDFLTKPFNRTILRSKIRAMERIKELHNAVNSLYDRMRQEEEIAQQMLEGVIMAGNVAMELIRSELKSATIFSGDLFLTAQAPSGDLYVLLGDFTGHGLTSALGAMPTADVFRAMTSKGFAPEQILWALNNKLHQMLPTGMFLGALFVRVKRELDQVQICNCGLPGGLVLAGEDLSIKERVQSAGLPLGILPDVEMGPLFKHIFIQPGDRVLLASDGVTEAMDRDGQLFGQERFEAAITTTGPHRSAIDRIDEALNAFCGDADQADDISMVEIPCVEELFPKEGQSMTPYLAAPWDREPEPQDDSSPDSWEVVLTITGRRLSKVNPVPLVINQVREMEGTTFDHSPLYTVLTELFLNALDHGVLGMDSGLKGTPGGFVTYFEERETRLKQLREGFVRFSVRRESLPSGWQLIIQVEDSGAGFDPAGVDAGSNQELVRPHGRGIRLVRAICSSLRYLGTGNIVEATFRVD